MWRNKSLMPAFEKAKKTHSKQCDYLNIKRRLIGHFKRNEYEWLNKHFEIYLPNKEKRIEFFNLMGKALVSWSVMTDPDTKSMAFIWDYFPHELVLHEMHRDDYNILKKFIIGECGLEVYKLRSIKDSNIFMEKLKLFFEIDQYGLTKVLEQEGTTGVQKYLTEDLKKDLKLALGDKVKMKF